MDGSFTCWGGTYIDGTAAPTVCTPSFNYCTPVEGEVMTCWRYDLGADVTCVITHDLSANQLVFACDSPNAGSFTCRREDSSLNIICP